MHSLFIHSFIYSFISITFSYKCDEFVINDTKTGDVQLVRDTLTEAAERFVCLMHTQFSLLLKIILFVITLRIIPQVYSL